jgi:hypothetical protein
MFECIWAEDQRYWQQKARLQRARALERKYIWDLQTEIINATIQDPRDQDHIDSLLRDLAAAISLARNRAGS